jgi:hypothetical protein
MPLLRRKGTAPSSSETNIRHRVVDDAEAEAGAGLTPQTSRTGDAGPVDHEARSRASSTTRPETPPVQEETHRHKRFSVLRFRNASDPQLSLRAKQQAEKPPPVPRRKTTRRP